MMILSGYPSFFSVLWTMAVFFAWIIWFWLLITVFSDLFRRHDVGGGTKVLWMIFVIILPYLGVFVYLIANHNSMTERALKHSRRPSNSSMSTSAQSRHRRGGRHREGQAVARQRCDHPGRVRHAQS